MVATIRLIEYISGKAGVEWVKMEDICDDFKKKNRPIKGALLPAAPGEIAKNPGKQGFRSELEGINNISSLSLKTSNSKGRNLPSYKKREEPGRHYRGRRAQHAFGLQRCSALLKGFCRSENIKRTQFPLNFSRILLTIVVLRRFSLA